MNGCGNAGEENVRFDARAYGFEVGGHLECWPRLLLLLPTPAALTFSHLLVVVILLLIFSRHFIVFVGRLQS